MKSVWCLFDGSGIMGLPWAEAGYQVFCFNSSEGDHGEYGIKMSHPNLQYVDCWIDDTFDPTGMGNDGGDSPSMIFSFPQCTFMANSGAKHDREDEAVDRDVNLAKLAQRLGEKHNCPWMVENPVGKLCTKWRKPDYYFNPYEYGDYLRDEDGSFHSKMPFRDGYTKKTCLWVGNGFNMPEKKPNKDYQNWFWGWKSLGGSSQKTKQLRSLTPRGFARAVFEFNKQENL